MTESAQHARLVKAILSLLEKHFGSLDDIMVRDDSLRPVRAERPPKLPQYIPDVYATDVPTTQVIVGEAKTAKDLETARSHKQIASFLEYLAHTPNSLLILAVPFDCKPRARGLLRKLVPAHGTAPDTKVIDDLDLEQG
ncbi:MAG: hypothetical protein OXE94_11585 [Aestuariivita sp.]|nr:hypothetical protein [Aestuariivita sp.]MCY4202910.1 hypothetical protein [Aestuariivita sp.]MCY4289731.1 hypothetical protein [Aestuariivita sp.]MCY4345175.1 hypothetical protein [Aestuariivita sp.]